MSAFDLQYLLGRPKSRDELVEPGDLIGIILANGNKLAGYAVSEAEACDYPLRGARLGDLVQFRHGDIVQEVRIDYILKNTGIIEAPEFGPKGTVGAIKSVDCQYGCQVRLGDRLFTLRVDDRIIEIRSPISGFVTAVSKSMGQTVWPGNRLARINYEPPTMRVHCQDVSADDRQICIRLDYQIGFTVAAREWVCLGADDAVGAKGRDWWLERVGRLPSSPSEALMWAKALPRPTEITYAPLSIGCPPKIGLLHYKVPGIDGTIVIDGGNCVFLPERDEAERKECSASITLAPEGTLRPLPAWWPRLEVPNMASLSDPLRRERIPETARQVMLQAINTSRNDIGRRDDSGIIHGLSIARAAANLSIAYNVGLTPLIDEIWPFIPSVWPSADFVFAKHREKFAAHLGRCLTKDWLSKIIEPRIQQIRDLKGSELVAAGNKFNVGTDGKLTTGLIWSAGPYYIDKALIPGIDVSSVFLEHYTVDGRRGLARNASHSLPFFADVLYETVRGAINDTRVELGLPRIGEGWFSETDLYNRVRQLFPTMTVTHHGQTKWLGRQHFDIWMPDIGVAIEYQGEQHFRGGRRAQEHPASRSEEAGSMQPAWGPTDRGAV
jgi:hypothetical protein